MWVKMKFENQMCCECIKIRLMVHKGNEECFTHMLFVSYSFHSGMVCANDDCS
jgi:hypothetical protein